MDAPCRIDFLCCLSERISDTPFAVRNSSPPQVSLRIADLINSCHMLLLVYALYRDGKRPELLVVACPPLLTPNQEPGPTGNNAWRLMQHRLDLIRYFSSKRIVSSRSSGTRPEKSARTQIHPANEFLQRCLSAVEEDVDALGTLFRTLPGLIDTSALDWGGCSPRGSDSAAAWWGVSNAEPTRSADDLSVWYPTREELSRCLRSLSLADGENDSTGQRARTEELCVELRFPTDGDDGFDQLTVAPSQFMLYCVSRFWNIPALELSLCPVQRHVRDGETYFPSGDGLPQSDGWAETRRDEELLVAHTEELLRLHKKLAMSEAMLNDAYKDVADLKLSHRALQMRCDKAEEELSRAQAALEAVARSQQGVCGVRPTQGSSPRL